MIFSLCLLIVLISATHTAAVAVNDSALTLPHNPSNLGTLSAPSDFDIEFSITHDYGPPLPSIPIYLTAITALEDLCFRNQTAPIPDDPPFPFQSLTRWSLPIYNVLVEVSSQQVRYAIWGIQLTAGGLSKGGYWPVIGRCFWRGVFVGRVDFAYKAFPLPVMDEGISRGEKMVDGASSGVNTTLAAGLPSVAFNSTAAVDVLDAARLTIVPTYNGAPISPREVFGTAINVMVLGAEYGPETYCLQLHRAEVNVIGVDDSARQPLLKYKHLIRAMSMLMSWMVRMSRFGEIDVKILRDEMLIGTMRIKKRLRSIAGQ